MPKTTDQPMSAARTRAPALAFALGLLLALPAAPARAADPVAGQMGRLLRLGFKDLARSLAAEPDKACAAMEHFHEVFGPLIVEYSTRSGDLRYKEKQRSLYERSCGHAMETPAMGDGD